MTPRERWQAALPFLKVAFAVLAYALVIDQFAALFGKLTSGVASAEGDRWLQSFRSMGSVPLPVEQGAPPLLRWDALWYWSITQYGYPGSFKTPAWNSASFFPLYPFVVSVVAKVTSASIHTAGIWVSRTAFAAGLSVLYHRARWSGADEAGRWAVIAAMLAYPSAFVMVSMYSEAMFFALAVTAFYLAERRRNVPAAAFACLASLTRMHGLVLGMALLVLAASRALKDPADRKPVYALPAAGAFVGIASLPIYFQIRFGRPWLYFEAKKHFGFVRGKLTMLDAMREEWTHITAPLTNTTAAYYAIQAIAVALTFVVGVWLLHKRRWGEAAFVFGAFFISASTGSFWGFNRFSSILFPIYTTSAALRTRPHLWYSMLIASLVLQMTALIHYVSWTWPAL